MTGRSALFIGVFGLVGCAIGLVLAPRDAMAAWLVAWLAWGAVPIGALAVLMLVALVPGSWRELYAQPLATGAALTPLVLVAAVPLLLGLHFIYPWTEEPVASAFTGFKGSWLSSSFFALRSIAYLLVLSGFAWGLISASPASRTRIAAIGLLAYALIGSFIGIDFGESTEPHFHSSIYGLLALTNQWLAGISFAIFVGLVKARQPAPPAAAGVLATAILLWGYMHAMQYMVIWAGDIPQEVRWYLERGDGGWRLLAWILFGLQGFMPLAALLLPAVRMSRIAMVVLAGLTLAMRLAENSWMVLPGLHGLSWAAAPLILAASAAMLGLGGFAAARSSWSEKWNECGWASEVRSV